MASGFQLTSHELVPRGKDIWTLEGLLGGWLSRFPCRMTIIRSSSSRGGSSGDTVDGGGRGSGGGMNDRSPSNTDSGGGGGSSDGGALLLVSSFPPTPDVLSLLRPLGEVRLVLAPNALHCLWGAAMRSACPGALLAGPPIAAKRFPGIAWDALVATTEDFSSLLVRQGFGEDDIRAWTTCKAMPWLQEVMLLHHPSRTLVVTDLAFNFKREGGETPLPGGLLGALARNVYLPLAGGYRGCCPTKPFAFSFLLADADAMCDILEEVAACNFFQVIVAHGDVAAAPGGKKAFMQGAVAFYQEVAARRQERAKKGQQSPPRPSRKTLLATAGAVAAVAAAFVWWRASSR